MKKTERKIFFLSILIFIGLFGWAVNSLAADYYVSPTGSASWQNCVAPAKDGSSACSWQTAMASAVAGDTVYFRGGDYDSGAGPGLYGAPVMHPANSGVEGSPITFKGYPGEIATIHEASGTGLSGSEPTIGCDHRNYITWDGLTLIRDEENGFGASSIVKFDLANNCVIQNSNLIGVTPHMDHTNGVLISVANSRDIHINNNKLHGMVGAVNSVEEPVNTGAMWLFNYDHIYVHNNDIYDVRNGIQMKADPRFIYAYQNHIWNCSGAAINFSPGVNGDTDFNFYQNVIRDCPTALYSPDPPGVNYNLKFYNNTFYNSGAGTLALLGNSSYQNHRGPEIFNNIVSAGGATSLFERFGSGIDKPSYADYNNFYGAGRWRLDGTDYSTISAWRTVSGFDLNSITGNPLFINAGGTRPEDYKLQAGSPAHIGRGGSYASVMGAYITGDEIIGYTSPASSSDTTPPAAPMGLVVQ